MRPVHEGRAGWKGPWPIPLEGATSENQGDALLASTSNLECDEYLQGYQWVQVAYIGEESTSALVHYDTDLERSIVANGMERARVRRVEVTSDFGQGS